MVRDLKGSPNLASFGIVLNKHSLNSINFLESVLFGLW